MTRFRYILSLILTNIFIFGILFLFSEIYLRIFNPQILRDDPQGAYVAFDFTYRPKAGYKAVAKSAYGTVNWQINSKGMRDNEIDYSKPPGCFRILGLGDSFTFGFFVEQEETFLHQLELLLNQNTLLRQQVGVTRFETINMGVGGYGTIAEHHLLIKEGIKYSPDMLVTALFVGNDIHDVLKEDKNAKLFMDRNEASITKVLDDSGGRPFSYQIRKFLGSNFHTYVLCSLRFHKLLVKFKLRHIRTETIKILKKETDLLTSQGWELVKKYLLKIDQLAHENGIPHIVVIIPMRHQVDITEWKLICEAYDLEETNYDLQRPQKIIKSFCTEKSLTYIDLLPVLSISSETYNKGGDAHFNEKGHSIVARVLYDNLVKIISSAGDIP